MKKKKILLTGITGLIGRHFTQMLLNENHEIHALIRPGTAKSRLEIFRDRVNFIHIDLSDIKTLNDFLSQNSYDTIVHIGALRGGRKFTNHEFFNVNVNATEQLVINALENQSKFIFCSSVGVFGAIPARLPANESTPRKEDNYYHFTKIRAESLIQNYTLKGLNSIILRPAITYGTNDYGFPYTLTKLVDKRIFPILKNPITIHLTNINLIAQAFVKAIDLNNNPGVAYNIADRNPVKINDLIDFINNQLQGVPYKPRFRLNNFILNIGESIARVLKNELWTARFELISKSWYFEVENSYQELGLKNFDTIPEFKIITDWYKKR